MKPTKFDKAIQKELKYISIRERRLFNKAQSKDTIKSTLEEKVPKKTRTMLEDAFGKAFEIVFEKGVGIIEKTYNRQTIMTDYEVNDSIVDIKKSRRGLKRIRKASVTGGLVNLAATTVEGVGLGFFGIGLPDIVAFMGMLVRGLFELSMQYGYDYRQTRERYFILMLMEGALSKDEDWEKCSKKLDEFIRCPYAVSDTELKEQMKRSAKAMALELVVLKFIQGLPLVGVLGGISNPVYYNKIMNYGRLKYYKRYLTGKMAE